MNENPINKHNLLRLRQRSLLFISLTNKHNKSVINSIKSNLPITQTKN